MKTTMMFDTESPMDRLELRQCMMAPEMANFIKELRKDFWRRWKANEPYLDKMPYTELFESFQAELDLLLKKNNIHNLDELTNM